MSGQEQLSVTRIIPLALSMTERLLLFGARAKPAPRAYIILIPIYGQPDLTDTGLAVAVVSGVRRRAGVQAFTRLIILIAVAAPCLSLSTSICAQKRSLLRFEMRTSSFDTRIFQPEKQKSL